MAKNDELIDIEEKKGNKFITLLIALIIIVLWLGMFALCIKLDVGGFGSSVMYPIFKNVPVINKILPDKTVDEEEEKGKQYLDYWLDWEELFTQIHLPIWILTQDESSIQVIPAGKSMVVWIRNGENDSLTKGMSIIDWG